MDIGSKNSYPANSLSNFTYHPFTFDGIYCNSMEGFLQSLKFKNPEMQKEICKLIGLNAKNRGRKKKWWRTQTLYWKGKEINRHSDEYQELLNRAYFELSKSSGFGAALVMSYPAILTHKIGNKDSHRTVLTSSEFCSRLTKLRQILIEE